eukprot:5458371-Prymnesium_polylepis.1
MGEGQGRVRQGRGRRLQALRADRPGRRRQARTTARRTPAGHARVAHPAGEARSGRPQVLKASERRRGGRLWGRRLPVGFRAGPGSMQ